MSNIDTQPFPRLALFAGAFLMAGSIVAAAVGRQAHLNEAKASQTETARPLAARDLTFFDMQNGSVEVRDGAGEQVVFVAAPGTNGFIRGVLRGMARDRHSRGLGQGPAFRLAQWPDGSLSLEDLATGKRIDLGGFGSSNRAAFAQLLGQQFPGQDAGRAS